MQHFSGSDYLKMDIASNFGLDKMDWDDRINWTQENHAHLEDLVSQAETPALYFAGVQALRKTEAGQPTGYPISLDAPASGLQLLACLTECRASASLCGVVSTGHRPDAYTTIYQAICQTLGTVGRITRTDTKMAIMTSLYSSRRIPREVFGEGEQLEVFYATMKEMAPGAWALNEALQALWQPYATSHDWTLPDNFHVHVKVEGHEDHYVQFLNAPIPIRLKVEKGTKTGQSISPNIIHSTDGMVVREMTRRCSYDSARLEALRTASLTQDGTRTDRPQDRLLATLLSHHRASGFLSARTLDLIDGENIGLVDRKVLASLIDSLPRKPFPIISIHDCFRCHPNNGNDLRATYNRILSEIAASDLLSFIASQVTGTHRPAAKLGTISQDILVSDYALC
jgi:hypothetical protein